MLPHKIHYLNSARQVVLSGCWSISYLADIYCVCCSVCLRCLVWIRQNLGGPVCYILGVIYKITFIYPFRSDTWVKIFEKQCLSIILGGFLLFYRFNVNFVTRTMQCQHFFCDHLCCLHTHFVGAYMANGRDSGSSGKPIWLPVNLEEHTCTILIITHDFKNITRSP